MISFSKSKEKSNSEKKTNDFNWLYYSMIAALAIFVVGFLIVPKILGICNVFGFKTLENPSIKSTEYMNFVDDFLKAEYAPNDNSKSIVSVKGFDLAKNTFTFRNLSSGNSLGGCCLGISIFEKNLFNGTLELKKEKNGFQYYDVSFIKKELNSYLLDQETIDSVYKKSVKVSDKQQALLVSTIKNDPLKLDEIYKSCESGNFFTFSMVKQDEIREILKAINYMQVIVSNEIKRLQFIPSIYIGKNNAQASTEEYFRSKMLIGNNLSLKRKVDITEITKKIDKDEPVILAFSSPMGGHAVLAYAYQFIDDETFKVFVHDSNIPLFDEKDLAKENISAEINTQIQNNVCAIFKKVNGEWVYKYEPRVNNRSIYEGTFNFYVPESYLSIM